MKGFTFCVTVKTSSLEWLVQYERTVAVVTDEYNMILQQSGGGGYLKKFCTGRLRPEVQPLTLSYTILAEKVPLLYTFY